MTASSGNNRNESKKPTYRKPVSEQAKSERKKDGSKELSGVSNEGHKGGEEKKASAKDKKASAKDKQASAEEKPAISGEETRDLKSEPKSKTKAERKESSSLKSDKETQAKESTKSSSAKPTGKHGAHAKKKGDDKSTSKDDAAPSKDKTSSEDSSSKERIPSMPKKRRPLGAIIGGAIAAVLVIACVGFGLATQRGSEPVETVPESLQFADVGCNDAGELVNPVNWDEWIDRNPDVYAWLQIEGTNVDYPILQHPVVDDYYLMRNIDGEPEINGTLYTQIGYNSKDFEEDPVTIIYGHTFEQNDTMFTTLHNLEDEEFFEANPTFYIFTPEERLEYEVISAFEYDNSHILYANDMADMQVRSEFFNMVQNPDSINKNVRELESKLDPQKDNILILSTCTQPANDGKRYLVAAVLKKVEKAEQPELTDDSVLEEHVMTQEELDALPDIEVE